MPVEYAPARWSIASARAAEDVPDLFPPDVAVHVSPDGLAWTTVENQSGIVAVVGQPVTITFTASTVRYAELRATRLAPTPAAATTPPSPRWTGGDGDGRRDGDGARAVTATGCLTATGGATASGGAKATDC